MTQKRWILVLVITLLGCSESLIAQCSICTKTASQLGDGPAASLNSAIIYLAFAPFAIVGFIGYKWWKREKAFNQDV
jgi:integral membrane sensor domain MASE1